MVNGKIYFGTNTKMYKSNSETVEFLTELEKYTADLSRDTMQLFVIPSYVTLPDAVKAVSQDNIRIGAQNVGWADEGQFTGEISTHMLDELGISLAMVGHSERRHVFGETDEEENKKVCHLLDRGYTALLCIGETDWEKEHGISDEVLRTQLKVGFYGVDPAKADQIWVAYEPVWAIGVNGKPASAEYANEKHKVIRDCLTELFGDAAAQIPVLYGGSVNNENACPLIRQPYVDGLYIGRSAWHADNFNSIIRSVLDTVFSK